AVGGGLAFPGGVAAVVVESDVVEPVRAQREVLIGHRGIGEGGAGGHLGELAGPGILGRVEGVPIGVQIGRLGFADVVVLAFGVVDHICGECGDDVVDYVYNEGGGIYDKYLYLIIGYREVSEPSYYSDPV